MAARVRIADGPYPADAGPGTLLSLGGVSRGGASYSYLLARLEDVEAISLASLRALAARLVRAGKRARFPSDDSHRVSILALPGDSSAFDREMGDEQASWLGEVLFERLPVPPTVSVQEGQILVTFASRRSEKPDAREVRARLRPFLERQDATATVTVEPLHEYHGGGFKLEVEIERTFPRGATLGDARRFGEDAQALVDLVEGDEIPQALALDLLRAGRWGAFRGRPESDWLEAKGAPYAEANARLAKNWKYELAKDVAAFANSPAGGLIVIGMTTKDEGDGEVITGFKEFDLKRVTASTYGNFIAQHVHPRVEGFEVVRMPGRERGRGIAALVIPSQAPANLPFLVRGVINDGEVLGNHVLWPVRQGDQTAMLDADGLHARLRLGDQAIKGQAAPKG